MSETNIFRALADPTRRAIYERLAGGRLTVSELREGLAVSQPAVSQHLAVLRGAGLVSEQRVGRNSYYQARPDGLDPLLGWIGRYRAFWPERIDRLRTVLKEMDQ